MEIFRIKNWFYFEKLEVFLIVIHLLLTATWKCVFLICPGGLKYNCVANVKRVCNVTLALQHVFQLVSTHFLINMVISKQRRHVHHFMSKNTIIKFTYDTLEFQVQHF